MIAADQNVSWLDQHDLAPRPVNETDWLSDQRALALERFEYTGLPGIRDEEWRFTNLRALKSVAYTIDAVPAQPAPSLPEGMNPNLVFVDGVFSIELSSPTTLASGVQLLTLDQALASQSETLQNAFGRTLPEQRHGFMELNTAYCRDGFVLLVADNAVCEQTLEVLFLSTKTDQARVTHMRNIIIAGANAQCRVVERHLALEGGEYLNNSITEILAGNNAHIDYYKVHQEASDAFHMGGVFVALQASAQVKTHSLALGGLVTRNDLIADLNGPGAHIEMNGLVLGSGRQHIDNHTQVNHLVANCSSDEFYKTILDDSSRSVFRGRIVVAQDAQLSNADQQNNNLLLSDSAEADTKPQLEIYADDVKCSHGATVGQLDPKAKFYLHSRGIDEESATALLTFAFANEVIERINIDSLRDEVTHSIAGALFDQNGLSGMEDLL